MRIIGMASKSRRCFIVVSSIVPLVSIIGYARFAQGIADEDERDESAYFHLSGVSWDSVPL